MKEIWSPIKGYEKYYQISNLGRVSGVRRKGSHGGILKHGINKRGYPIVALCKNGRAITKPIHRLVAIAFLKTSQQPQINHKNGIKTDNRVENLEWCTNAENMERAIKMGLVNTKGDNNHFRKTSSSEVREIRALWKSGSVKQKELANKYGLKQPNISEIVNNKIWTHI